MWPSAVYAFYRLLSQATVATIRRVDPTASATASSCRTVHCVIFFFGQGLSSVLDAASRGLATKPKSANKQPLLPSGSSNDEVGGPKDHRTESAPDDPSETRPSDNHSSVNDKKNGKGGNPDPFERIETVALSSLAGALKILSAAVGGVGEAVFQTGTVAEGLAGGTGQVAGENMTYCSAGNKEQEYAIRSVLSFHSNLYQRCALSEFSGKQM